MHILFALHIQMAPIINFSGSIKDQCHLRIHEVIISTIGIFLISFLEPGLIGVPHFFVPAFLLDSLGESKQYAKDSFRIYLYQHVRGNS